MVYFTRRLTADNTQAVAEYVTPIVIVFIIQLLVHLMVYCFSKELLYAQNDTDR